MNRIIIILIIILCMPVFTFASSYKEKVIERENIYTFKPLNEHEGALSVVLTLLTMCENFKIIDNVRKGKIKHDKLKDILDTFDMMILDGINKKNFIKMYNYLNEQIPDGNITDGSMDILEVLNNGGDCNDVSPLFYNIFRYYGFDNIWVIIGQSWKNNENILHAWIYMEWSENGKIKEVELDPLWYQYYIELNRISKDMTFEIINVKDKYHRKRF